MSTPETPHTNASSASPSAGKPAYVAPRLVRYGSLEAITKASSAGTILDGGTQPNKNTQMNL